MWFSWAEQVPGAHQCLWRVGGVGILEHGQSKSCAGPAPWGHSPGPREALARWGCWMGSQEQRSGAEGQCRAWEDLWSEEVRNLEGRELFAAQKNESVKQECNGSSKQAVPPSPKGELSPSAPPLLTVGTRGCSMLSFAFPPPGVCTKFRGCRSATGILPFQGQVFVALFN